MMSRHSLLAAVVVGALTTTASSLTTTWVNPAGGAWDNPQHWSNGVPAPGDIAVFPAFPGTTSYDVHLDGTLVAGVVQVASGTTEVRFIGEGSLTLAGGLYVGLGSPAKCAVEGPTMNVVGQTIIGGPAGGTVVDINSKSTLTSTTLLVAGGSFGDATLTVRDQGTVVFAGSGASVGTSGPGTLSVVEGATFAAASLNLGSAAVTRITLTDGDAAPIQLFGPCLRDGALQVLAGPSFDPPANAQIPLIQSSALFLNGWEQIFLPEILGEVATLVSTALGEMLQIPDPYVGLITSPSPVSVAVGFASQFQVYKLRASGIAELLCCGENANEPVEFQFSPGGIGSAQITSLNPLQVLGVSVGTDTFLMEYDGAHEHLEGLLTVLIEPTPPSANERISVLPTGEQSSVDTPPGAPLLSFNTLRVSPDGRYVLFTSCAPEFLSSPGGPCQIYLKDRVTGAIELVSRGPNGDAAAGGTPAGADMSADARYVVFAIDAPNFGVLPPAGKAQIWLRDRVLGTTTLVTGSQNGEFWGYGNNGSYLPRITPDGAFVVFSTDATNLVTPDFNGGKRDIIRWEQSTGESVVVTRLAIGGALNTPSNDPVISDDGRYVAFSSAALNVVPRGAPVLPRILLKDMLTNEFELLSVGANGFMPNDACARPSMDATGRFVAFDSQATNITVGGNAAGRVYLHDRETGETSLIDVSTVPLGLAGTASSPSLSADGKRLALVAREVSSPAFPLIDTGVFRVDVVTGSIERLGRRIGGDFASDGYGGTAISGNGNHVLFASALPDLAPNDTNGQFDIFLVDLTVAITGDLDGDGLVGPTDLARVLGAWGATGDPADLDGDGVVGPSDLALLLGNWSPRAAGA